MRIIKKMGVMLLALCMFSTLFVFQSKGLAAKAEELSPVHLYFTNTYIGHLGETNLSVYAQIKSLGDNEKVSIWALTGETNYWREIPGTKFTKLSDGTDLWKIDVMSLGPVKYAIKYEVNGKTYWDNNNGNNYTQNNVLGTANIKVNKLPYLINGAYPIVATVKNLGYEKVVKVRYTLDNWKTVKEANLSYKSSNSDNTEVWQTTIEDVNMDGFQYAVSYEVNGQVYWDNCFGQNYTYTR